MLDPPTFLKGEIEMYWNDFVYCSLSCLSIGDNKTVRVRWHKRKVHARSWPPHSRRRAGHAGNVYAVRLLRIESLDPFDFSS